MSEDAVSGHIQLLIPGETACFACAPPLVLFFLIKLNLGDCGANFDLLSINLFLVEKFPKPVYILWLLH